MVMTGHRSQEQVKTVFKMQFDLFLWHYKSFLYHQIMSERPVCGEDKNLMYILMMNLICNPLRKLFYFFIIIIP